MEELKMLVLSRKESQVVHVGDNIKITVVKVQGNSIRIGIEAPKDVRILRGELVEWHDFSFDEASLSEEKVVAC
jgi:carbon storage regulator